MGKNLQMKQWHSCVMHSILNIALQAHTCFNQMAKQRTCEGCHDEYELRVKRNKVQLTRIRDENGKFRSNSILILFNYKYNHQIPPTRYRT